LKGSSIWMYLGFPWCSTGPPFLNSSSYF
jgi:hypothetical protein